MRDGDREIQMNPKDPDSAATSLNVVLLKANKGTSKVFYIKGYDKDTSEGQKPDCYSNDGVEPAADAQNKQAKKCDTCPHNQWGSRVSEKGATKGKACADAVRMAVAPAGQINDAMMQRVPPASIKALCEYGQMLAKRGVGYNMVTRIMNKGFYINLSVFPSVPYKNTGLRIPLTTGHSFEDIYNLLSIIAEQLPFALKDNNSSMEEINRAFKI